MTFFAGFLAGFAYTFNILGAALKLRGEGTGWSSASYISVWAHNVLFIFVVSAFLILHIVRVRAYAGWNLLSTLSAPYSHSL